MIEIGGFVLLLGGNIYLTFCRMRWMRILRETLDFVYDIDWIEQNGAISDSDFRQAISIRMSWHQATIADHCPWKFWAKETQLITGSFAEEFFHWRKWHRQTSHALS